ncbi:RNA polymerase sigma-70 factor [Pedobacter sp. GR22-6]|uniref:RNA polymerase sigma-70 factor n=1 Tax=Pedobacter sp. GR22-6 TaxID=3127957 RepID=UPI00307ECC0C
MSKTLNDLPDQTLLEKFRDGNAAAFNVLFKRYYNGIKCYAQKNVRDAFMAEELSMDVMLGLWKNKGAVEVQADLKPFLYRSIKNAIYNHYRKKALQTVSLDVVSERPQLSSQAADHDLQVKELQRIYNQQLEKLSPQRRRVYEMSRLENKSYSEIAEDLNLSVNTVENYMVASLAFFRKNLKEHADLSIILAIFLKIF